MIRKLFVATALSAVIVSPAAFATVSTGVSFVQSPVNMEAQEATTAVKSVTVINTTPGPITFGATTISGGSDPGDFGVTVDTCASHTIPAGKRCHVDFTFTANQPVGTTETTTITLNDSSNVPVGTDDINGLVLKDTGLSVTKSGSTVYIKNPTPNQYGMDYSYVSGTIQVTGGTCVDVIFQASTCTLTTSGSGELEVEIGGVGNFFLNF
jgi:hypothetical protein